MDALIDILPWILAMTMLIALSGFFSASEAAFFSLRSQDRRRFRSGKASHRTVLALLAHPERLLSSVLFGNLVVNLAYFAVTSIAGIQLERHPSSSPSTVVGFTLGSLLAIIFFSEMLPKTVGVLMSRQLALGCSFPLSIWARVTDPMMPVLQFVNLMSIRLIWPQFEPESDLEISDLDRAIEISTGDADLVEYERATLRNIVGLSDLRVDECMRPRTQLQVFRPPATLADLDGKLTPSGYMMISEPDSDEIMAALNLKTAAPLRRSNLERLAVPVVYCPWFTTVAEAFEQMIRSESEVVAVVNEIGETVGALTREDVLDIAFSSRPGRTERLINRDPIQPLPDGSWRVFGITNLRRLGDRFEIDLPETQNVTVAGVAQECLQRLPVAGDTCRWGPLQFEVLEASQREGTVFRVQVLPNNRTDSE